MKIVSTLTMCVLGFSLTACSVDKMNHHSTQMINESLFQAIAISDESLNGTWRLMMIERADGQKQSIKEKHDTGLSIQFMPKDKRLYVLNGCNHQSAPYYIEQGRLNFGAMMSTRRMCEPELMKVDRLASQLFQIQHDFKLEKFVDALEARLIVTANGEKYYFAKVKTS